MLIRRIIPLAIAAAGIVFVLDRENWPREGFFPPSVVIAAGVMGVVAPLLLAAFARAGENKDYQRLRLAENLRPNLAAPLATAIEKCDGKPAGLSVHVYQVQRVRRAWWWVRGEERHVSVAKQGLSALGSSGVCWNRKKGVIGRCWQNQAEIVEVLGSFRQLAKRPKEWAGWGTDAVYNLTYDDYQRLKTKYALIIAVPVTDHKGRYVGCVALNSTSKLKNLEVLMPPMRRAAEAIAATLQKQD